MKKHKPEMIAAWAKENGIYGYEMYDPRNRENDRRKKNSSLSSFLGLDDFLDEEG